MIFTRPFPWTQADVASLVSAFKIQTTEKIEVKWYWEPFHSPGFRALKYAAQKKISSLQFEQILEHLSCPQAPAQYENKLKKLGIADDEGRVLPLDPEKKIRETYFLGQRKVDIFENAICPRITQLKLEIETEVGTSWSPEINGTAEFTELSTWLTNQTQVLNRFHSLGPWEKLELLEIVVGVNKSSSSLHFSRIVQK